MITQTTIDRIKLFTDIVDVVGDFVTLKKKGKDLTACCPFHQEKTPSFYVSPAKGIFKCFGCGKAGDAITFVMEHESLSYTEALKYLAAKYNIEVEEITNTKSSEELASANEREALLIVLNWAKNWYRQQMAETEEGRSIALAYFRERGLTDPSLETFELGYAPEGWDIFFKAAQAASHSTELLEKAGLIIRKDDGRINDRFRGRVIFPIHNAQGKVIAYGARTLSKDKNQPKYLNSPETEVYHKSQVLYGLFQARQAIRQADNVYLTEGYMDVIAMHQAGVANVVASSGTSLTEEQIRLISRYTKNVTVLYDGDAAGIRASLRGIDMLVEQGMNIWALTLPDGDDPDSYIRKAGASAFQAHVQQHRQDFLSFKIGLLEKDAHDAIAKGALLRDVIETLAKMPDAINRSIFVRQASERLQADEQLILTEINRLRQDKRKAQARKEGNKAVAPDGSLEGYEGYIPEEYLDAAPEPAPYQAPNLYLASVHHHERESLRLLITYAPWDVSEDQKFAHYYLDAIADLEFRHPLYARLLQICRSELAAGHIPGLDWWVHHPEEDIRSLVMDLVFERYTLSENWFNRYNISVPKEEEILDQHTWRQVLHLKYRHVRQSVAENMRLMQEKMQSEPGTDPEPFIQTHLQLQAAETELAKLLGIVVAG